MIQLTYSTKQGITTLQQTILRRAIRAVWPDDPVQLIRQNPGTGAQLAFGENLPSNAEWSSTRNIERILAKGLREAAGLGPEPRLEPKPGGKNLYLDIESHSADEMWNMDPDEFLRLGQYAWGPYGDVHLVTSRQHLIDLIEESDVCIVHNGHAFDWTALYGKDSTRPLELALEDRLFDTMVFANLAFPAPIKFTKRDGRVQWIRGPGEILIWLSLDNLAFQLGVDGKIGDLKAMAKEYGGFGSIPLDHPEFREYAEQDVRVLQELTHELLTLHPITEYDWREQLNAAIDAQNSRNGFKVNREVAQARVDELAARREEILSWLVEKFDFPTTGKSPWASAKGKDAIMRALAHYGITPENTPTWTKTATGNISLGGEVLIELTEGTEAEEFGRAVAELKGQRSLAQLALDSIQADGFAHPQISSLQRSGRKSTTKPGLTVWSARDQKYIVDGVEHIIEKSKEKAYFIPDNDDELLVELDYSNADQRVVAAYSGDTVYLERMVEDFDGHEMSGRFLFGDEVYDSNPKALRQAAKPAGHGWAYRASANAIVRGIKEVEVTKPQAQGFIDAMNKRYSQVVAWQDRCSAEGERGYVTNAWGRKMIVESGRSYTQSPALYGQSGTREIMVDALIRMARRDIRLITWLKAQVHDALVFSIPKSELDWAVPLVVECMETTWQPPDGTGQPIHFPVSAGTPSTDWQKAGH